MKRKPPKPVPAVALPAMFVYAVVTESADDNFPRFRCSWSVCSIGAMDARRLAASAHATRCCEGVDTVKVSAALLCAADEPGENLVRLHRVDRLEAKGTGGGA